MTSETTQEILDIQNQLVGQVIGLAPRGWKRLFLNHELQDTDSGMSGSSVFFAARKKLLGKWERVDLQIGADELIALTKLGRYFMAKANQRHLTVDLVVRDDGAFRYYLDYESPIRLGGDLLADRRHLRYADGDEVLSQL